ncbi:hypothetical protein ACWIEX_10020 [Bosea sp. NPDC055353]
MNTDRINVSVRPRPIRIAFLIDISEDSHSILDEVFQYCFSIWSGRFSLIVPCIENKPVPEFMPWLRAFDADLIYSYVDLSKPDQFRFHEAFYPSVLQRHSISKGNSRPRLTPEPAMPPLQVKSLMPLAGAASFMDGSRGVTLATGMGGWWDDRFISDSFGLVSSQLRNALRGPLSEFGSLLAAVPDNEFQPREQYFSSPEKTVPDEVSLLYQMTRNHRIKSLSRISALMSQRLDFYMGRWGNSFNIVVGNTVSDRILYWNARSLMPIGRDWDDVDLMIPREKFEDTAFVTHLREFMNQRNYIGGGGQGPHKATLRSVSLRESELDKLAQLMMNGSGWIAYDHEHISDIRNVRPKDKELAQVRLASSGSAFRPTNAWQEQSFSGDVIALGAPAPEHVRHVPPSIANADLGLWALDVDIDRSIDHSRFSNRRHTWRLPRRLRVTGAFLGAYGLSDHNSPIIYPRASINGHLALFAAIGCQTPTIHLPSDHYAILHALRVGRAWPSFERFGEDGAPPERICARVERSPAGRYFWGVYQLFGDLKTARAFLLHAFWRKQLKELGATDQRTEERQRRVEIQLKKRIGIKAFDPTEGDKLATLANMVLQEADAVRSTVRSLRWDKIKLAFDEVVDAFISRNNLPIKEIQSEKEQAEERDGYASYLKSFVQDLCSLGVLHQGYEHTCRQCLHRSWTAIADLKTQITCEVCHSEEPAPVDRAWQFRLNGFLREALQRHGIGPLFWVLDKFQQSNSTSFWFDGPLNIFFNDDAALENRPNTDVDLTIIENGIVRMCEVKQSDRQFLDPEGLAQTMLKLRPDIAMIAVMEADSDSLKAKFARFSKILEGSGIKAEILTLDTDRDFSDSPYF